MNRNDPRYNAYLTLCDVLNNNKFSAIEIDHVIANTNMNPLDRALYTRLVYGVLERKITIDHIVSLFSERPAAEIDTRLMTLLRLGIYQIIFCSRIPESAAVNESVNICRKIMPGASGFVNGVLRSVCRKKDRISFPEKEIDPIGHISLSCSVSPEIVSLLAADYGAEKCEKILSSFNNDGYTTIRVNTLVTSRERFAEKMMQGGFDCEYTPFSENGIRTHANVRELFAEYPGEFFVQDEASQMSVMVLSAKKGDTVADVCACPGGKSFSASMDMENSGSVYSFDLHKSKLSLITKEAGKLGISIISVQERDGRKPDAELIRKCDKVICDVPCSGLGVLSKKPEMRYKDMKQTESLPEIQYGILSGSAEYLKRGGTLVYSTCTLLKRENERIIDRFISQNGGFSLCPFEIGEIKSDGMLTLFPDEYGTDGFFISKLIRK